MGLLFILTCNIVTVISDLSMPDISYDYLICTCSHKWFNFDIKILHLACIIVFNTSWHKYFLRYSYSYFAFRRQKYSTVEKNEILDKNVFRLTFQLASLVLQRQQSQPQDPYASNWLERLRQIKRLKAKVLSSSDKENLSDIMWCRCEWTEDLNRTLATLCDAGVNGLEDLAFTINRCCEWS